MLATPARWAHRRAIVRRSRRDRARSRRCRLRHGPATDRHARPRRDGRPRVAAVAPRVDRRAIRPTSWPSPATSSSRTPTTTPTAPSPFPCSPACRSPWWPCRGTTTSASTATTSVVTRASRRSSPRGGATASHSTPQGGDSSAPTPISSAIPSTTAGYATPSPWPDPSPCSSTSPSTTSGATAGRCRSPPVTPSTPHSPAPTCGSSPRATATATSTAAATCGRRRRRSAATAVILAIPDSEPSSTPSVATARGTTASSPYRSLAFPPRWPGNALNRQVARWSRAIAVYMAIPVAIACSSKNTRLEWFGAAVAASLPAGVPPRNIIVPGTRCNT